MRPPLVAWIGIVLFAAVGLGSPCRAGENEAGVCYEVGRGLQLRSGRSELRLTGRLLLDVSTFDGAFHAADGGREKRELYLRSAVVDVLARRGDLSLFLQHAVDSQRLILAFATYKGWKTADVVLGRQKEPFGLDYQSSSRYLATLERPMVQALVPGISTGLMARGLSRSLTFAGGVFDQDGEKALTARLTWVPLRQADRIFHSGLAISWRDHGGAALRLRSRGEVRQAATRIAQSSPVEAEVSTLVGLELAGVRGPLSWQAEAIVQQVETAPAGSMPAVDLEQDVSYWGAYLQGSYFLTGELRGYSFQRGRFIKTRPRSAGGAWELVARYSQLDLDDGEPGTRVENLTIGVNWHLDERLRLMANFVESEVRGRAAADVVGDVDRGSALTLRLLFLI